MSRKFFAKRGIALLLLFAMLVLGGVPSPFFTLGDSVLLTAAGWVVTAAAVMLLFSTFYFTAPNRERPSWHSVEV